MRTQDFEDMVELISRIQKYERVLEHLIDHGLHTDKIDVSVTMAYELQHDAFNAVVEAVEKEMDK